MPRESKSGSKAEKDQLMRKRNEEEKIIERVAGKKEENQSLLLELRGALAKRLEMVRSTCREFAKHPIFVLLRSPPLAIVFKLALIAFIGLIIYILTMVFIEFSQVGTKIVYTSEIRMRALSKFYPTPTCYQEPYTETECITRPALLDLSPAECDFRDWRDETSVECVVTNNDDVPLTVRVKLILVTSQGEFLTIQTKTIPSKGSVVFSYVSEGKAISCGCKLIEEQMPIREECREVIRNKTICVTS